MDITVTCGCGKKMFFSEQLAGEVVQCLRCRRKVAVPRAKEPPPPPPVEEPTDTVAQTGTAAPPAEESAREYVYWLLILALIPLVMLLTDTQGREDIGQKLKRTIRALPEERQQEIERILYEVEIGDLTFDDLMKVLPDRRMQGALFPRDTDMHWVFTLGSTVVFWLVLCLCFSHTRTRPLHLLAVGLFTSTMGVGVLLLMHLSPLGFFMDACMASPHQGGEDFLQVLGYFTLFVGFFEELAKQLPIMWYFRRYRTISWRRACLWGLASGVGFGISEGVMYSSMFYNGVEGLDAYLVRFISCVGLHAVWAAAAAVAVSKNQVLIRQLLNMQAPGGDRLDPQEVSARPLSRLPQEKPIEWFAVLLVALRVLAVVMFLHGLYDAALTERMDLLALGTALASFGWLAWLVEGERSREGGAPAAEATTA